MARKKTSPAFHSQDKIDLYEKLICSIPGIEHKGVSMPYTSLNGNMFSFIDKHGSCGIRLPEKEREDFIKEYKTGLFETHGTFLKEYVTPNGRLLSVTQTAYVLALQFDMLPENQRGKIVDELVENIKSYRNHLTTGFLGTPYLCHVLSRFGKTELAYQLLLQETYPSWLYPVKMGATTIWERWDGIKPDGSLQTPAMNSYNHYAYGAIGDWMYRVVTGIDTETDSPGYKKITKTV